MTIGKIFNSSSVPRYGLDTKVSLTIAINGDKTLQAAKNDFTNIITAYRATYKGHGDMFLPVFRVTNNTITVDGKDYPLSKEFLQYIDLTNNTEMKVTPTIKIILVVTDRQSKDNLLISIRDSSDKIFKFQAYHPKNSMSYTIAPICGETIGG